MEQMDMDLLLSVVKGLGSFVPDSKGIKIYCKDEDCLPCLKDLQRLLRQDKSETRESFQVLGQYNIAMSDLVPIIVTYSQETEIVYNSLKVLTYLTMPVDSGSDNKLMQAEYMQLVKEAFMEKDAMAVIVGLVAEPLSRHPRMSESDGLMVQLVITFIRNLLAIPDRASTAGSGGDHRTRLRQELLTRMFDDNVMELLLVIAQHADKRPFKSEAPLLMEIFQQIFKGASAADLTKAAAPVAPQQQPGQSRRANTVRPKGTGMASERAAMERQMAKLRQSSAAPARHARFGGLFVKRYHREDRGCVMRSNPLVPSLPAIPQLKKTNKTQVDGRPQAQLQSQLLWKLRQYLDQLLQAGSFGVVMNSVMQDLKAGLHISRLSREDFVCFFRLAQLATTYVRIQQEKGLGQKEEAKKQLQQQKDPANNTDTADSSHAAAAGNSAALPASRHGTNPEKAEATRAEGGKQGEGAEGSPFACVSVILGWETFHMVHVLWIGLVDMPGKAPEKDWEMQHESLGMLKEMLFALDLALHVGTPADKKAADRLQRRLLHDDMKESGLLPVTGRLLKSFNFAYQPRSHAVDLVQALHVILRMLNRLNASEAGGFLVKQKGRAAGARKKKAKEGTPEQMEESPSKAANGAEGSQASPSPATSPAIEGGRTGNPFEEEEREAEEEARRRQVREVAYDLQRRVKQELAFPAVIHFYSWLLQGFATNGTFLNHCLVAFLRRIADPAGLNLEPMLYQLSVLRVFQAILSDKAFRKQEGSGEVTHLAAHVTRNLFARLVPLNPYEDDDVLLDELDLSEEEGEGEDVEAVTRREARKRLRKEAEVRQKAAAMMFIELMFWKNASVAESVRDEYNWRDLYDKRRGKRKGFGSDADSDDGQIGFGSRRPKKQIMSEEQATDLKDMFEEVNGMKDCLQRCVTGMGGAFKKSQISRQLKAMGLKRNRLTDSQEERLRGLYEKHHEDRTYLAILAEDMPGGFSKGQISSQLRKLGLKKSKGKKSKGRRSTSQDGSGPSSSGSDSDADSQSGSGSDSSADLEKAGAEQQPHTADVDDDAAAAEPGHQAASGSKRKKGSTSKKAKKQKRKASHANIDDWSSDNNTDAEPVPLPDQLDPMSDSDNDKAEQAAAAAASDDKADSGLAGKKKRRGEQRSAGHNRKSKGSSSKGGIKKKSRATAKQSVRSEHAKVNDWTSDDSSDAQPEQIADEMEPMSDSDADNDQADSRGGAAATKDPISAATSKQKRKAVAGGRPAESNTTSSLAQHDQGRTVDEEDWGQAAAASNTGPSQHAKRKGRLRKARAPPDPAQQAAAGSEADDIMVDLEDDVPELETEADGHDNIRQAADRPLDDAQREYDSSGKEAGWTRKGSSKSLGTDIAAGRKSSKQAERRQDKQSRHDAENKVPGNLSADQNTGKRLKKQVDIPHAARSALNTLKSQRLQKQAPDLAPSPAAASPPLHDTLPASGGPIDPPQLSDPSQATRAPQPRVASQGRDPSQPAAHGLPVMGSMLTSADDLLDRSKAPAAVSSDMPPVEDTVLDPMDESLALDRHAAAAKAQAGAEIDRRTSLASVQDTMDSDLAENGQQEAGDDDTLIRQAVEDDKAGAECSSPALAEDDDEMLL